MYNSYREVKALAACRNFTRAAEELNMSQPALSRHILELEERVGAPLFYRNPVALTPAGVHYLEGVGKVLEAMEELYGECRQLMRYKVQDFTIAAHLYGGKLENAMYLTCARMLREFPTFSYSFETSRDTTIEQAVFSGAADIGVIMNEPEYTVPEGVEAIKLFDQHCFLLTHKDNPHMPGPVRMAELTDLTVLESPNRKLRVLSEMIKGVFRGYGIELHTRMKNFESVAQAAVGLRTDEVLVFTSDVNVGTGSNVRVYDPNIARLEVEEDDELSWPLYLIYRPDNQNDATRLFMERLREELAGL